MTSPRAGQPAAPEDLVDIARLVTAYFALHPDPAEAAQRVSFGTSGHRGSALTVRSTRMSSPPRPRRSATTGWPRASTDRCTRGPTPTRFPSLPRSAPWRCWPPTRCAVLLDARGGYTPDPVGVPGDPGAQPAWTPDRAPTAIVVTPSHNPPPDGGFKYNPPDGGPAASTSPARSRTGRTTLLAAGLTCVRRIPTRAPGAVDTTGRFDFLDAYVSGLGEVVHLDAIRADGVRIGADLLGGASVSTGARSAERYGLDLTVVNPRGGRRRSGS